MNARERLESALTPGVLMNAAKAAKDGDGAEMRRRLVDGILGEDPSIGRDLSPREHALSSDCWCGPTIERVEAS